MVNIIVPFWAKSAATLVSIGGSNIIMDEFGEFGPLDAQIGKAREDSPEFDRESALNDEHSISRIEVRLKEMYEAMYIRIYEHKKININKSELSNQLLSNLSRFYEPLLNKIDPYKLGEKRRKLDIGAHYARRILLQFGKADRDKARALVDYLVNGCPDHGYVIDYDIMTGFLDNIHLGLRFGDKYAIALSKLSTALMSMEDPTVTHSGFVGEEKKTDSKDGHANARKRNGTGPKGSGTSPRHLTDNIETHGTPSSNGAKPAKDSSRVG